MFKIFEFAAKKSVEESVIIWKIPEICKLQERKRCIEFDAGESQDLPCKWRLELGFTTGNANDIGLHLYLIECPELVQGVYATYSAAVKYSETDFITSKTAVNEYKMDGKGCSSNAFLKMDKLKTSGILNLAIHVRLMIYGEVLPTPICSNEMIKEGALNGMSTHFPEFLKSGEYADLVIRVKALDSGEYVEKKVHRIILSSQSTVFKTMLGSPMSEKATGVVTIEDLTPTGLNVLLEFMYAGSIPDSWKHVPEEIVNAAEKYNLPLLKQYIGERIHEACTPENAFSLFNFAKERGLVDASKHILKYIKSNVENVLNLKI